MMNNTMKTKASLSLCLVGLMVLGYYYVLSAPPSHFLKLSERQQTVGTTGHPLRKTVNVTVPSKALVYPNETKPHKVTPEEYTFNRIEEKSSLPLLFSLKRIRQNMTEAKTSANCSLKFPNIYTLHHHNIYWQELQVSKSLFYLLSAFFDDRVKGHPFVRVMVVTDSVIVPAPFCQIWHKNENVVTISRSHVVRMFKYIGMLKRYRYVSQIVNCPLPPGMAPEAVSLVEKECDVPTNVLRVVDNKVPEKEKQEFLVCYRAVHLPFEDKSQQIIEWFEYLKIMGVNKVHLHILSDNPRIRRVFDYYEMQGLLETRDITLPGYQPNLKGLQHIYMEDTLDWTFDQVVLWEHIPLNDCLYRNMFRYKYIIVQDMDHILVPVKAEAYHDLVPGLFKGSSSHLAFDSINFYDQIEGSSKVPSFMYMMSRVFRRKKSLNFNSIYNPIKIGAAHSHDPMYCLNKNGELKRESCVHQGVGQSTAKWHHYPAWAENKLPCNQSDCYVRDTSLWRFKDRLTEATNSIIHTLFN